MNLDVYVKDAVRTESKIDKVMIADEKVFEAALQIFIHAGNILDRFKKNAFYGKEIDWAEVAQELEWIDSLSLVGFIHPKETELKIDPRVFHALIGIATESTELMEALYSTVDGNPVDYVNILEEFGDVNWYEAIGIDAMNGDFNKVLTTNIEKLRMRFPEKFTSKDAIERNLEEERNTLETGLDR